MPVHRVLADEVRSILGDTELTNSTIADFIGSANVTVTALLGDDTTLTTYQLREIERYLAAHIIKMTRERQVKAETVDGNKVEFGQMLGKGLDATTYGQTVKMLDTTGTLASESGVKPVQLTAITSFE